MEEHPFELNMTMQVDNSVLQTSKQNLFRTQLVELANSAMEGKMEILTLCPWLLNSGARSHYVDDLSKCNTCKWLNEPTKIITGSGVVWGLAIGDVTLYLQIGRVTVKNVLLVPDLVVESDLLSVAALMDAGLSIHFESRTARIQRNGLTWGTATSSSNKGLFYLIEYDPVDYYLFAMQCTDKPPFTTWHCQLGYINGRTIRSMTSKVTGMIIGDPPSQVGERNIDCADCLRGTHHQIVSRYPFTPTTKQLTRVSAGLSGPMRLPDCTCGYRYLLVIIDYYSQYNWVFPLISKGMTLRAIRIFQSSAENQSSSKLLVLQTDGGGEFTAKEFTEWTQDSGINHMICAPYASSMNLYVERVIKSIISHASAMLWYVGVGANLWALAAKASAYLHNRVLDRRLPGEITPYEMWHGSGMKPHVGHIRVWGCRAWAAVLKEKWTKWQSKSSECILVGFYDTKNLYQLWHIEKRQLIKIKDVVFHQHLLGHPTLARNKLTLGWEITGNATSPDEQSEFDTADADDVETLYSVIEETLDHIIDALKEGDMIH